ncbi:MAG TPA: gluconeogenesis factor YvcK family protein, partial [Candidatus Nanoarchaeia archaeon]
MKRSSKQNNNHSEPKIVVFGGGTGIFNLLRGLKRYTSNIVAIVTMMDSGGSSGRLRDEFGHLPPGDVRQALVALSPDDRASLTLRQLFNYRFSKGEGLEGHSFGNLFLTALTDITGGADKAIAEAGGVLGIRGRVYPVTLTNSNLVARLEDGSEIVGETNIDMRKERPDVKIDYVYLDPKAYAYPEVLKEIETADVIVLGPGDLYTSVIPNLLVDGVTDSINY